MIPIRIAFAACVLLAVPAAAAAPGPAVAAETGAPQGAVFSIRVADGEWGNVQPREIEAMLDVIAADLLSHFPGRSIAPIIVSPSPKGPIILYRTGPDEPYRIQLAARHRLWGEYIYEFSHELFHVLANYERHAPPNDSPYQWFEEMLCEAASLHSLKALSQRWDAAPPRPEWAGYGPELKRYTARAFGDPHRRLPAGTSFAQWFEQNAASLDGNPYLRQKNDLIAMFFLPLLEGSSDWRAISHLNLGRSAQAPGFREFLNDWYAATPAPQRSMVVQAMALFQYAPPGPGQRIAPDRASPVAADAAAAGTPPAPSAGAEGQSR